MHTSSEASHDYIDLSNQLPLKPSSCPLWCTVRVMIMKSSGALKLLIERLLLKVSVPDKASLLNVRSYLAGVLGEQHLPLTYHENIHPVLFF